MEPGQVIKIKARGRVKDINKDTGQYDFVLEEIQETTKAEKVRISEQDGGARAEDLDFIFGEVS